MTGKTNTQNKHSLCIAQICGWALQFGNIIYQSSGVSLSKSSSRKLSDVLATNCLSNYSKLDEPKIRLLICGCKGLKLIKFAFIRLLCRPSRSSELSSKRPASPTRAERRSWNSGLESISATHRVCVSGCVGRVCK